MFRFSRYLSVRVEDFADSPLPTLQRVYDFTEKPMDATEITLARKFALFPQELRNKGYDECPQFRPMK